MEKDAEITRTGKLGDHEHSQIDAEDNTVENMCYGFTRYLHPLEYTGRDVGDRQAERPELKSDFVKMSTSIETGGNLEGKNPSETALPEHRKLSKDLKQFVDNGRKSEKELMAGTWRQELKQKP
ncbi:hypothetical protein STEG23_034765 [Scotinomys teguina]